MNDEVYIHLLGTKARNTDFKLLILLAALIGFSSSAFAADDAKSSDDLLLTAASPSDVLVFGKFQLLKNGEMTQFSDGFLGNSARIYLYHADWGTETSIKVGKDGEFSKELPPGDYYVMSIAFKHRGETIEAETNLMFNVSPAFESNYIGTITLQAKFSSGYHGMKGVFERFIVTNDCATDCGTRLASLGLAGSSTTTSLPEWQQQVAFRR